MTTDKTDKAEMSNTNWHIGNPITLLGIGIFSWVSFGGISYLLKLIARDICHFVGIGPLTTIFTSEVIDFATFIFAFLMLVNVIKAKKYSEWKVFWVVVILLIIGQSLQFLESVIVTRIANDIYRSNLEIYLNYMRENSVSFTIERYGSILSWFVIIAIVLINKTVANTVYSK